MLRFVCDGFVAFFFFVSFFFGGVGVGFGGCLSVFVFFFSPVLFESAVVASCLPHCFCNLQPSKLFSNGDKEPYGTSLSLGFAQSPLLDLPEAACKSQSSIH